MYPNYTVPEQNNYSSVVVRDPCFLNVSEQSCFRDLRGRYFCRQKALILDSTPTTNLELISCLAAGMYSYYNTQDMSTHTY